MLPRRDHLTGVILGFLLVIVAAAEYLGVGKGTSEIRAEVFGVAGALGALLGIGSLVALLRPAGTNVDPETGRPRDLEEYERYERAIVSSKTHFPLVAGRDAEFSGQPAAYIHTLACGHLVECRVHHMARIFCDDCFRASSQGPGDAA
jgi:hypothetical protein